MLAALKLSTKLWLKCKQNRYVGSYGHVPDAVWNQRARTHARTHAHTHTHTHRGSYIVPVQLIRQQDWITCADYHMTGYMHKCYTYRNAMWRELSHVCFSKRSNFATYVFVLNFQLKSSVLKHIVIYHKEVVYDYLNPVDQRLMLAISSRA